MPSKAKMENRNSSWELGEEADVVLEEDLEVVDAVLEHRQAVHAHAESEAADLFRVVIHKAVDGGIDHARAEKLDPAGAFAFAASGAACARAGAAAENARDVEFDTGLGKRKIAGAEARLEGRAEELLDEVFDGAGEIAESDVGIDGQPFDLVEHEGMRGVGIVAAIDLAGNDDAHRRFLLFHGANLNGRGVRAEKELARRTLRQAEIKVSMSSRTG